MKLSLHRSKPRTEPVDSAAIVDPADPGSASADPAHPGTAAAGADQPRAASGSRAPATAESAQPRVSGKGTGQTPSEPGATAAAPAAIATESAQPASSTARPPSTAATTSSRTDSTPHRTTTTSDAYLPASDTNAVQTAVPDHDGTGPTSTPRPSTPRNTRRLPALLLSLTVLLTAMRRLVHRRSPLHQRVRRFLEPRADRSARHRRSHLRRQPHPQQDLLLHLRQNRRHRERRRRPAPRPRPRFLRKALRPSPHDGPEPTPDPHLARLRRLRPAPHERPRTVARFPRPIGHEGDSAPAESAAAQLAVTAERIGGNWFVTDLAPR